MKKVAIIHHSNERKERCIMKKLAIISTGLLLGFFVFLTGFPTVATAAHRVCEKGVGKCLSTLQLSPREQAQAEVLLVLGKGGSVIIIQVEGHTVRPDEDPTPHDRLQHPSPHPDSGKRSTIVFQPRAASGCVTINGRNYCW